MTTSAYSVASASTANSFWTSVRTFWEALTVSMKMARIVSQPGYVTSQQVKEVRALADRL